MIRTLQMVFRNHEGRNVTISVPDARDDLLAGEVEDTMTGILSRNIFSTAGGDIVEGLRAQVVSRQVDILVEF